MSVQILNNGETGLQVRNKINQNFAELYNTVESVSGISTLNIVLTSDSRLTDSRSPIGIAAGDLQGNYPNPTIKSSVVLLGEPTAPTATESTNNTQIATTEFVHLNKGDKYRSTSYTINTINEGTNKTFVVSSSSLSYTPAQDVTLLFDSNNYMHGTIISYSGYTLVVYINSSKGSGTYSNWTINVGGVVCKTPELIDGGAY